MSRRALRTPEEQLKETPEGAEAGRKEEANIRGDWSLSEDLSHEEW